MEKTVQYAINKRASLLTIAILLCINVLVALAAYDQLYVAQTDFSKLKPDILTSEIDRIAVQMPKKACLDAKNIITDVDW